ncbi:hypothetical protein SDC9_211790 [bioreactor metagenome]|uniref:Uncharacterized protein n=1 Tax=bioreactor metagenome TaxID=1076179 RepID=A0A645JKA6_9ZZZZ
MPAQKRLKPQEPFGERLNLRLKEQFKLVVFQCLWQRVSNIRTPKQHLPDLIAVVGNSVSRALCLIEGKVCLHNQLIAVCAVLREAGNATTCRKIIACAVYLHRLPDGRLCTIQRLVHFLFFAMRME